MNGRIYDPLLGRFLSADTVVQAPGSLQSYNRYSYVMNNPLSLFDPSGFSAAVASANMTQFARDAAPAAPVLIPLLVEGAPVAGAALTGGGIVVVTVGGIAAGGYLLDAAPGSMAPMTKDPYACDAQNMMWAIRTVFKGETAPPPDHTNGYMTMQSANGQQAAAQQTANQADAQSTAPQPAVSQNAPAQSTSGGQMNSQEPPTEKPNGGANQQQNPENQPKLTHNPKHNQNSSSPEPKNAQQLFEKSVPDKNGVRWAVDKDGTIHRFAKPSNGETHWNGSTAGKTPIQERNIPNEIRKALEEALKRLKDQEKKG